MDTPDRDQIGTPISKFEDSPVFNYINSLSPIKPLKSINIASTFNPLNFTSPPSVFSSPHVSSHKEFRFLRGHHQFSELSKPEFLSPNGKECGTSMGVLDALQISDCSADPRESSNPTTSTRKVSVDPTSKHSKIGVELPQTLRCDSGSPENNLVPCHDLNTDHVSEVAVTPLSLIHFVQHTSEERSHLFGSEVNLQGVCHIDQNKEEGKGCEWENLISDAAELLNFDSTSDAELSKGQAQKSVDCGTNSFISVVLELPQDNTADLQKAQLVGQNGSYEQHDLENIATQPGDIGQLGETEQSPVIISHTFPNSKAGCNPGDILDDSGEHHIQFGFKAESQQQRGMLRRCLVFEMVGAHKKNIENDSSSSSSISCQSDGNIASEDKSLVPYKPGAGPSPCMLPGIGLHLNALATTSKDCRVVKHEILASGRQLISMPSSISSFRCPTSVQKPLTNSSALNSVERDDDPDDNAVKITEEASHLSSLEINEDLNQSSPKKKRRKLEHAGESESCRRCNCKKSKCLKLYCECFAAGVYCVEPCSCQDCFNKPVHEGTVLATRKQIESRNPLAFAPKVIRSSDSVIEIGDNSTKTPASARHKRGCNCKKSSCLKKYCECFQGGVGCSMNCRCEGCKNTFGRKDGSAPTGTEDVEPEDGETENCEKSTVDKNMQSNEEPKNEEQYPDSILPITPSFQIFRPYVQLPFSSSSKPPRSFLPVGSSKNIHASQRFRKPDFSCPQSKSEKHFKTIAEDETPEILRSNCSPNVVKSTSPNSKRVSPPHSEFGLSPGRRSGRKLILQSIPSFPSLSSHDESNDCPGK